jgi:hypothetical protein
VSLAAPRQCNVFFASAVFAAQYEPHVQPLRDAWRAFLEERMRQLDVDRQAVRRAAVEANPALLGEDFNEFIRVGHATNLHTAISNGFFWHAGDYRLEFMIDTDTQLGATARYWRFSLTVQDEQNLRLNVVTLIRKLCYLPVVYNFAYKEYVVD